MYTYDADQGEVYVFPVGSVRYDVEYCENSYCKAW